MRAKRVHSQYAPSAHIPPNPPSQAKGGITFLHGWAMHGGLFRPLFDALGDAPNNHVDCRRLDLPGHGQHRELAWPDSVEDWIVDQTTEGSWLVGWSLGGQLALQAALKYPGHFRGLILIAATPCFVRRAHWPHGIDVAQLDALGAELERDPAAVIQRFLALEVHGDADASAQLRLLRAEALKYGLPDARALRIGLNLLKETDLSGQLENLDLPVLLLGGRRDRLVGWPALEAAAAKLPRAELVRIPGSAHAPFLTRPEAVAQAIARFALTTDHRPPATASNGH